MNGEIDAHLIHEVQTQLATLSASFLFPTAGALLREYFASIVLVRCLEGDLQALEARAKELKKSRDKSQEAQKARVDASTCVSLQERSIYLLNQRKDQLEEQIKQLAMEDTNITRHIDPHTPEGDQDKLSQDGQTMEARAEYYCSTVRRVLLLEPVKNYQKTGSLSEAVK